jgi:NADH:ubiquinone oxidoreductase subunit 5 (subunit L)/multisubunit Na+/H+ antiporter MnhA subunit
MFYAGLVALRQLDVKRVIAYASISHMNFAIAGLFTNNVFGAVGAILMMFNHGLVAAGLFYLIGIVYERYHTRLLYYFGGLAHILPIFSFSFFILTLCNCSFPGTCTFISEFLILVGLVFQTKIVMCLSAVVSFLNTSYSFWLYNRVCFGQLKLDIQRTHDILVFRKICDTGELWVLSLICISVVILGLLPHFFLDVFGQEEMGSVVQLKAASMVKPYYQYTQSADKVPNVSKDHKVPSKSRRIIRIEELPDDYNDNLLLGRPSPKKGPRKQFGPIVDLLLFIVTIFFIVFYVSTLLVSIVFFSGVNVVCFIVADVRPYFFSNYMFSPS